MPPIPQLPDLPKEAAPPVAVIGVLSVPEVMQKSTAAQGVQAIIQQRQAELGHDAQHARAKIQAEQARILAERGKLSDSELEAREQALRDEIAATQTKFEERNQAIQNSGQAALGQIESELIGIIRQEAQAHGMNLVLHREQVALNVNAFDITDDVVSQLNKLLPSVKVPPSVVTPGMAISQPGEQVRARTMARMQASKRLCPPLINPVTPAFSGAPGRIPSAASPPCWASRQKPSLNA